MERRSVTAAMPAQLLMADSAGSGESDAVQALIQRCVAGDASAFDQIVIRYERRVLVLACRVLGNMPDAQEAAQDAFVRAFRYIHRFDTRKPFEPWLVRLAVNACRDLARKRQQLPLAAGDPEIAGERAIADETCDPEAVLAAAERKQVLLGALGALPENERLAVVLRDLQGYTTREVAHILGSSETTVRCQVSRGRVRLRKILERGRQQR